MVGDGISPFYSLEVREAVGFECVRWSGFFWLQGNGWSFIIESFGFIDIRRVSGNHDLAVVRDKDIRSLPELFAKMPRAHNRTIIIVILKAKITDIQVGTYYYFN